MKKIIGIILTLTLALSCSVLAFGDAGGPPAISYDVTVSNKSGAEVFDVVDWIEETYASQDIIIPYGTQITVVAEYSFKDTLMLQFSRDDTWGFIKASDVTLKKAVVGIEETVKNKNPETKIVLEENKVKLYAGPGLAFEEIATLDYGTRFSSEYAHKSQAIEGEDYVEAPEWAYVTVDGNTGWVHVIPFQSYLGTELETPKTVIVMHDKVPLYAKPYFEDIKEEEKDVLNSSIKKGTVLSYKIVTNGYYNQYCFVEYDGVEGWILNNVEECDIDKPCNLAVENFDGLFINSDNVDIYEDCTFASKVIANLPKGTVLPTDLEWREVTPSGVEEDGEDFGMITIWFHAEYEGKQGWVPKHQDDYASVIQGFPNFTRIKEETPLYISPDKHSQVLVKIPAEEKLISYFWLDDNDGNFMEYTEYNGLRGWFATSDNTEYVIDPVDRKAPFGVEPVSNSLTEIKQGEVEAPNIQSPNEEAETATTHAKETNPETIKYASIGAAVFLLVAAVAIVVVIKKKKGNVTE